jgi:hypothetical protein
METLFQPGTKDPVYNGLISTCFWEKLYCIARFHPFLLRVTQYDAHFNEKLRQ